MEDRLKEYIEKISKSKFDLKYFKEFIGELLTLENKDYLTEKENKEIKSIYRDYIESYTELVRYKDKEKKVISVMVVKLKDGKMADNSRSKQRNFIADILKDNGYDASIVAIYSETNNNWRLSFVKIEGVFELGKFNQKVSPAKRYSYLFGENEPNHTAKKQLSELLVNMDKKYTVKELEAVFDVEAVSIEFFKQYKKKYNDLYDELEKNIYFKQESEKFGFSNEEFCKKLMGQIVFLYFIQKKGWLGVELVPKNMDVLEYQEIIKNKGQLEIDILNKAYKKSSEDKYEINEFYLENCDESEAKILSDIFIKTKYEKAWGTGRKDYLRSLFDKCKNNIEKNFYDDYLEPLFYEALNEKRDNQYYKIFNAKIPYLNGGLFEPIKDYRWKATSFKIDNKIFSNKTNDDDEGTGILDFFDRYNFTIDEEEPMEKDVAVDPEMLGKIFENLLDVKDRKSKGIFYTPREIVHYMCQESLANYLVNKVSVDYNEIKEFILYGDILVSMDLDKENDILKDHLIGDTILSKMYEIDKALNEVKIADPAVGSGAFPLGMLNEIVRMRGNATHYLRVLYSKKYLNDAAINHLKNEGKKGRTNYQYKWNAIENSIYAVDIEPSAVDITKLRLWLSLVVDQELENDDDPHTLPNLDCKIMSGNSLIDEYKGIKLFDNEMLETLKSEIKDYSNKKNKLTNAIQISFQHNQKELQLRELKEAKHKYYNAKNKEEKIESKNKIANIRKDYLKQCFEGTSQEVWLKFLEDDKKSKKEYFSWQLEFIEVFTEKDGFDIVIGNPPYVDYRKIDNLTKNYLNKNSSSAKICKTSSLYIYFIEFGIKLCNSIGNLIYINPYQFLSADSGKGIRNFIFENKIGINKIIDVSNIKVFSSADTYTCINSFSNKLNTNIHIFSPENIYDIETNCKCINYNDCKKNEEQKIILNSNHIIEKLDLINEKLDCYVDVFCGSSATGLNNYIISDVEYNECLDKDYVPFLMTSDFDRNKYKIKKYIDKKQFNVNIQKIFNENENLFLGRMTKELRVVKVDKGIYCGKVNCITNLKIDRDVLWAILNSNLLTYYYRIKNESKHMSGGYFGMDIPSIKSIPIKEPDEYWKLKLKEYVIQKNISKINCIIYKLYNIDDSDKETIESELKNI